MQSKKHNNILIISDMHIPYHHPDMTSFLSAVKKRFKPQTVICIGDEIDGHAISFHESDPDLMSAGDELTSAIKFLRPIFKLFPKCIVIDSNHGSLAYRKGKFAGLPKKMIRTSREILDAPKGWSWQFDLTLETSMGKVYFHHGKSSKSGGLAQSMGMNAVQGHFHSKFQIEYLANPNKLYWDMHVGSLADDKSLAMGYNKTNLPRPIVGVGMIIHGKPQLIPMVLKPGGRWVGKL